MWASSRARAAERPSLDSPRMRSPRRLFVSLSLLVACALGLAACGGDEEGTIPPEAATAMRTALENARAAEGNCEAIQEAASTVSNEASQLPDSEERGAVIEGAENLFQLANEGEQCEPSGPTGTDGPTGDTTDEPAIPEDTAPTDTTPTEPPEDDEQQPPEQPENEGGGNLGEGDQGGQPPSNEGPSGPPPDEGAPPDGGGVEPPTGGTGEG
jgi:hypothetical protein